MSCWWFRSSREKREGSQHNARMTDAALRGDDYCLAQLLKNGRWTSAQTLRHLLGLAVKRNHVTCIGVLLEAGADALGTVYDIADVKDGKIYQEDEVGKPLLVYAAEQGLDAVLALLLQYGGDVPFRRWKGGDTLLHLAARRGHTTCLEILLHSTHHSSIVSYNDAYETPATLAVTAGFYQCFLTLIDDGSVEQMDGEGRNLLHLAAVHGRYAMVERLLVAGYAVDETDFEGHTPIIDAVLRGHVDIVKLLVGYSEIDFPGEKDRTALMFAAQVNALDSLHVLLGAGAVVNQRDKHGNTALILGIKHEDMTARLLSHGALTDMQNHSGVTALWYAAYYSAIPSIHCLLKANSNPELTGEKSLFPLEVALERGHFDAAKCIIYAGCPLRNIIYTLKQYTTIQVMNRVMGGVHFSHWVEEWLKQPASLKYSCRRVIRRTLGTDSVSQRVAKLPLPRSLIHYVDLIDLCQFYNKEEFAPVNKEQP